MRQTGVLYDSPRTRVVRATDDDGRLVVVKSVRDDTVGANARSRTRREAALLEQVGPGSVPRVVRCELGASAALVTEDLGGIALDTCLDEVRGSAARVLDVAIGLADALSSVHAAGVLHRDVTPGNVLLHPETDRVWLIDFDLASPAPRLVASAAPLRTLEGTPPYLAPEQTGRMNRVVDQRSDLYSVGATLYELVAGRPPFVCDTLRAYAHAHLARTPERPESLVVGLPTSFLDVVLTLLSKRPEDRYQSAAGLAIDLRVVRRSLRSGQPAVLRGRAVGDAPELPQDLAGRDAELEQLGRLLERVQDGASEIALVSGHAGIGKTALVRELVRPASAADGTVVEGKFDAFTRDRPYAAITQVLDTLARDVLADTDEVVAAWRTGLLGAVGPNARLLADLSTGMATLLGDTPEPAELGPTEARLRMLDTLGNALETAATLSGHLVVFLDDLQWADTPSLLLVEHLAGDPELSGLLLILAWRDDEVRTGHPLEHTLDVLATAPVPSHRMPLAPLQADDLRRLVADALLRCPDDCDEVVDVLLRLTGGNPFHLRRLMVDAAGREAFRFDARGQTWTWDLQRLVGVATADDASGFLDRQLGETPPATRQVLATASLVGNRFDLAPIAAATGLGAADVQGAVTAAVRARLVTPLDRDYWPGAEVDAGFRFAFVHDRIQEAARDLLDDAQTQALHLALARAGGTSTDADLFATAEHYTAALPLVTDAAERDAVRDTTTRAGTRALAASAHEVAERFLAVAIACTTPQHWAGDRDGTRALWLAASRSAWLVGDLQALDARVAALRDDARDVLERLQTEEVVVQASIARGDLHEALDTAIAALAAAGTVLPRKPGHDDVMGVVGATLGAVSGVDVDTLPALPDDDVERAVRRLLVRIASAAYVAEPDLLPLIACHLIDTTLAKGASSESAYAFAVFGLVLCAGWLLEAGTKQSADALRLLERFPDRVLDGTVRHVVNHYPRSWAEPLRRLYDENPQVFRSLVDVGDLEYAGWVAHLRIVVGFLGGVPLDLLVEDSERVIGTLKRFGNDAALACALPFDHLVKVLRHPAGSLESTWDAEEAWAAAEAVDFRAAMLCVAVTSLIEHAVFGRWEAAAKAARQAVAVQDGAVAIAYQATLRVLAAMALLETEGLDALDEVMPLRAPLATAAALTPGNFAHDLHMFDAEVARARGDVLEATRCYDLALEAATDGGFLHVEGFVAGRAATLHADRGATRMARAYRLDARRGWMRWGADAAVASLDAQDPTLASAARASALWPSSGRGSWSTQRNPRTDLDLASLLDAARAIAEEVDLDRLLERAMRLLVQNLGATRAVLLLERRGELRPEALCDDGEEVRLDVGADEVDTLLPLPVARRVFRAAEPEVLGDLTHLRVDTAWSDTPHTGSALCAPVAHQGRTLGVLWFENSVSDEAFTDERLAVLDLLGPQLAISIRNAQLVEAQDRFVPRPFLRSLGRQDIVDVERGEYRLREVSVLFSDIWSFTSMAAKLGAADTLTFVNEYLACAEPPIGEAGGFIDNYLGDGIMALFDAAGRNALQATKAAVGMHRALDAYNAQRSAMSRAPVRTGIGINTGTVTMGTIGGAHALWCGVLGDAVNVASRVEALTRTTGARVVITEQTEQRLPTDHSFHLRLCGRFRVRGRAQPLDVHEVLDAEPDDVYARRLSTLETYRTAMAAFRARDFGVAREGFGQCVGLHPDDLLAARYAAMSSTYAQYGVPAGWDGILEE